MGQRIVDVVESTEGLELLAGLDSTSDTGIIKDADLLIDSTRFDVSEELVAKAIAHGVDTLIATSGWSEEKVTELRSKVDGKVDVNVVVVPNFALGSVLATWLATMAAQHIPNIEIIESHHNKKVDSPSGTAVRTAELVGASRATVFNPDEIWQTHRDSDARGLDVAGIPVHSLRLPGIIANQKVVFGRVGETVTIEHDTTSPAAYEYGIREAIFAVKKQTGGVIVGLDNLLGWTK